MAGFDGSDLKKWRSEKNVSAADLAERISCDVTTIYRYESGKIKPDPDVMYQMCRELGDVRRWHEWMRTEYPRSYGKEHPSPIAYDLPGSVLSLYAIVARIEKLRQKVSMDAADGTLDNDALREKLFGMLDEMISAGQAVKALLPGGGEIDGQASYIH